MNLRIVIPGVAAPQGSKRHVGNGRLIEMSKRLPEWRKTVAAAIKEQIGDAEPVAGPVHLWLLFTLPRPKAAKGRARPHLNGPGDLDKLVRGVSDAITTSGYWRDDSQVVELHASKFYASEGADPGVGIEVTEL